MAKKYVVIAIISMTLLVKFLMTSSYIVIITQYHHAVLETLERRKKEYSSQYDDEIRVLKDQVNTILEQKSAVEAQRVDLMAELETSKKKQHQLEEQLQSTKTQLICSRDDLKELKVRFAASEKKYSSEVDLYQTKLKEQSDILKEYQDKVAITRLVMTPSFTKL